MKTYPSIPTKPGGNGNKITRRFKQHYQERRLFHIFDKLDGSNIRFLWDRKQGWSRFGSRTLLIDRQHPLLGESIDLFMETFSEPLEKIAREQKWQSLTAFCEFWGDGSLAGQHVPGVAPQLTLFDVAPFRLGLLPPQIFLELFQDIKTPNYLGKHEWCLDLEAKVRNNKLPGVTFEGIIGKAEEKHLNKVQMFKSKTQPWLDAILARFGEEEGSKLINS